jgi:hypothetical protein
MGVSGSGKNPTPGRKIDSKVNRKHFPTKDEAQRILDPPGMMSMVLAVRPFTNTSRPQALGASGAGDVGRGEIERGLAYPRKRVRFMQALAHRKLARAFQVRGSGDR